MKRIICFLSLFSFISCGQNSLDCFQSTGDIIQQEIDLDVFKKIIVFERVQLFISQGDTQRIVVETGENLLNEIYVRVEDSILKVSNSNSCNFTREYGITKVFVTSPDITEIRNSSGLPVESIGSLNYDRLNLVSDNHLNPDEFHVDGDFFVEVDVNDLRVNANGLSRFYLKGRANNTIFAIYDSDVIIEASQLEVQNLLVSHRGTNLMTVNPQNAIRGKIFGIGNVISVNRPTVVEVEELFTGRLIFQ